MMQPLNNYIFSYQPYFYYIKIIAFHFTSEVLGRKKVVDVFEIPENFLFDQAKMEMKLGNQIRTIDLANLGKIFCEYDITDRLEYDSQNEPTYQTILREADCYYLVHKKRNMVV